ncbi:MAG: glycosyltransferase [Acidimicrobiia bacterium]|nr:glycosyltransferase [Acidimicrobiia bacterium]
MRVLHVVTDTDRRGAQVFATDLDEALRMAGVDSSVVALTAGTVGGLDLPTLGPSRRSSSTLRVLRRTAARADVVVAHGSTTLPACAVALAGSPTPFVYRQISDSLFWAPSWHRRLRVRTAMSRAAAIVALWDGSAATLVEHLGVGADKIAVIPNGVPPARFPPLEPSERASAGAAFDIPGDAFVVACVSALAYEKGVDLVLGALEFLPDDVHLLVAGDGPERAHLERTAAREAPGRVHFTGSLSEPRQAFATADVVALASRGGDSMPATLIEAGLLGLPSVATPVEGIVEIIDDGVTGSLLFAATPRAVANAVDALRGDADARHRLGAAARQHCLERYAIEVVAEAWSEVLTAVTERRRPSQRTPTTPGIPERGPDAARRPTAGPPDPTEARVLATVLTFDDPDAADACLGALGRQHRQPDAVLVVDNAGARPAAPSIDHLPGGAPVRALRTARHLGPAGGHARALEEFLASDADSVWILDDDVRPRPDALAALLATRHEHHPALVEPRTADLATGEEERRHGWWGVLLPRHIVEAVGLPNAELFWWTEDTEYLQWRIPQAGFATVRTDDIVVDVARQRASAAKPAWKYYYEARNQVHHRLRVQRPDGTKPVRHHLKLRVRAWRSARSVSKLAARSVLRESDGRATKLAMVARGTVDGVRGRLGATVTPTESHRPDPSAGAATTSTAWENTGS